MAAESAWKGAGCSSLCSADRHHSHKSRHYASKATAAAARHIRGSWTNGNILSRLHCWHGSRRTLAHLALADTEACLPGPLAALRGHCSQEKPVVTAISCKVLLLHPAHKGLEPGQLVNDCSHFHLDQPTLTKVSSKVMHAACDVLACSLNPLLCKLAHLQSRSRSRPPHGAPACRRAHTR